MNGHSNSDLWLAVSLLEHCQSDVRTLLAHPEEYDAPIERMAPIMALITALRGRLSRWIAPTEDERRRHERRQNERRSHHRRWEWGT
jgi:hypothetical protein